MKRFTKTTYCDEKGNELVVLKPNGKASLTNCSYTDFAWPQLLELGDACRAAAEELRSLQEVAVGTDE
jgi:hypothetical protein